MKGNSIILFLLITCLISCVNNQKQNQNQTTEYKIEVKFKLPPTSDPTNKVSLGDDVGNSHDWDNVPDGWTYTWQKQGEKMITVAAYGTYPNNNTGDFTINFYKNGELVDTKTGFNTGSANLFYYQ
jgi:hypothetical protein